MSTAELQASGAGSMHGGHCQKHGWYYFLRLILHDYRNNFRSGMKNIYHESNWFMYFYLLIYPALILHLSTREMITLYGSMITELLSVLLARLYPLQLNRTLYLVPMSAEDKRRYLMTGYWCKVGIGILMMTIFALTAGCTGLLPAQEAELIPFWLLSMLLSILTVHIYLPSAAPNVFRNKKAQEAEQWAGSKVKLNGYYGCYLTANIAGLLAPYIFSMLLDRSSGMWEGFFIGWLLMIQLITGGYLFFYFRPRLAQLAMDYELAYAGGRLCEREPLKSGGRR